MVSTPMFLALAGMFLYCFWFIVDRLFGTSYSTDIIFKYIPKLLYWSIIFVAAIPYGVFTGIYWHIKNGDKINYRGYHFHFSFKKPVRKVAQKKRAPYKPARKQYRRYNWLQRRVGLYSLRHIPMNAVWSWNKIIRSGK